MVDAASEPSLFHETWWLDAAHPGAWEEVSAVENGRVVGRWPFCAYRPLGFPVGGMAPLTTTLGPWVAPLPGRTIARRRHEMAIVADLAERLPRFAFFRQVLPPVWTNMLPFQLGGFLVGLEHTLEIRTADGPDAVWTSFQDKLRNQIRASTRREQPADDVGPDEFLAIHAANVASRGVKDHLDRAAFLRLYDASVARGAGRIIGVRNGAGTATAALFVVHSSARMHHLLQTRHPHLSTAGAIEALTWRAIRVAAETGLIYDFDGVPNATAAARLLRYGGTLANRFVIRRGWPVALVARDMWKTLVPPSAASDRFP